jgi:hypothetical protein
LAEVNRGAEQPKSKVKSKENAAPKPFTEAPEQDRIEEGKPLLFKTQESVVSFKVFSVFSESIFSESTPNFVVPLKKGLEAKDLGEGEIFKQDEIFKQMGELLGENWQESDTLRFLERQLRDQDALAEAGEDPERLDDINNLLTTELKRGLEVQSEDNASQDAGGDVAQQFLTASRFEVYLKGVPRKAESGVSEFGKKAEKQDEEEQTFSSELEGAVAIPDQILPVLEVGKPKTQATQDTGARDAGTQRNSSAARFSPELKAPLASGATLEGSQPKTSVLENRVDFDRFFQGVLGAQSNAREGVEAPRLELSKGAHLSQNEALREGLENTVRFIRASGVQKAELIVDPPALGRVSVELTSTATGLEAALKVSSEQVRQLVQDQLLQLRFALAQQGVELTHFSVDVQQDGGQRQRDQSGEQRRGNNGGGGEADEETVLRVDLNEGLLYWVA